MLRWLFFENKYPTVALRELRDSKDVRDKKLYEELSRDVKHGVEQLKGDLTRLEAELMDLEMILVEQVNGIIDEFMVCYAEIASKNTQSVNSTFKQLQDIAKKFGADVLEHYRKTVPQLDLDTLEPALQKALGDKDALSAAVEKIGDLQDTRVQNKADELNNTEEEIKSKLFSHIRRSEILRDRQRVTEISEVAGKYSAQIDDKLAEAENDD